MSDTDAADRTPAESAESADRHAVIDVLNRYAEALDHRDWELLDEVFLADATADYGAGALEGRDAIVGSITDLLGGCGPSQHLLGNFQVLDAKRGKTIFQFQTGGPIAGGVVTYTVNGKQYVALEAGNLVVAFSLAE